MSKQFFSRIAHNNYTLLLQIFNYLPPNARNAYKWIWKQIVIVFTVIRHDLIERFCSKRIKARTKFSEITKNWSRNLLKPVPWGLYYSYVHDFRWIKSWKCWNQCGSCRRKIKFGTWPFLVSRAENTIELSYFWNDRRVGRGELLFRNWMVVRFCIFKPCSQVL